MHNNNGNPNKIGTNTPVVYETLPATQQVIYDQLPSVDAQLNVSTTALPKSESDRLVDQLREKVEEGKGGRAERSAQMLQKQGLVPQTQLASQVGSQQLSGQNQFPQQQGKSVVGPQLPQTYPPQQQNYGQLPKPAPGPQSPYQPLMPLQQVVGTQVGSSNYGQLPKPTAASPHLNLSDPAFQKEMLETAVMTIVGLTKPKDVEKVANALGSVQPESRDAVLDLVKTESQRTGIGKLLRGAINTDKLAIIAKGAQTDGLLEKPVAKMSKEERLQQTAHIAANYPEVYKQAKDGKQDVCKFAEEYASRPEYSLKQKLQIMESTLKEPRKMVGPVIPSKSFAADVAQQKQNTQQAPGR
jgi:hypothetical protein